MLLRTPTAGLIILHPAVQFKSVHRLALRTDGDHRQLGPDFPVKPIPVHAEVIGGIPQPDQARRKGW